MRSILITAIWACVSCILFIGLVTWIILIIMKRRKLASAIDKIPGPPGVPLLGVSLKFFTKRENIAQVCMDLTAPYAANCPIMKIWLGSFPVVLILRSDAAKILLNSNKHIEKAMFYKYFHSWIGDGLITSTGLKWQRHRKLITPCFHFRVLENFLSVMNEQAAILIKILERKCEEMNNLEFDIYPYIARCALDMICGTAMGQGVDAQINADSEYVNAINKLTEILHLRILRPWLAPDWLFRLTSFRSAEQNYLKIIHGYTDQMIKMKKLKMKEFQLNNANYPYTEEHDVFGQKRRTALLDMLLETAMQTDNQNIPLLSDIDIRDEVTTFMFAGHDTVSVVVSWALYKIGQDPELQADIVEELNTVFGSSNRPPTSNDIHQLRYLECVIKEIMRIVPIAPMFARTLTDDLDICGYAIPKGVTAVVIPYWIHRDPAHFTDPEKFDPKRFLPENSHDRDPFAFIPFSAGPRNCIGQKYGLMEAKVILSQVIKKFVVHSIVEDGTISNVSLELVTRPIRGIRVKLAPRKNYM